MTHVDLFVAGANGVHTYRIPSLLATSRGTLLAFCEARKQSTDDATPTDIVLRRGTDGGRTWSAMQVLVRGKGREAIMNPTAMEDRKSGAVILVCMNAHRDGRDRHRQLMLISADDGKTWSSPVDLSRGITPYDNSFVPGPGIGIQTTAGRLVVPGYTGRYDARTDGGFHSRAICSEDGGRTWRMGEAVSAFANEAQAVELADGWLLLNMRDSTAKKRRAVAVSEDGAQTWSDVVYHPDLNECPCQASMIRFSGGPKAKEGERNLLLFANPDNSGARVGAVPRTKMTVKLSFDEGKTWPVKKLVHPGPSGYSGLARLPNGDIGLIFEGGTRDYREWIRFVRFSAEWLTADDD